MGIRTTAKHDALQRGLESTNWKAVERILSSFPTHIPKNLDSATITKSLEDVRAAADTLIQACDFNTAFEFSFAARKALIDSPSVLSWATQALEGFAFEERVIGRIAAMLALLGMESDGRAAVGCAGAVDQLTIAWSCHPTSIDIVKALVSLCSGHIDNVSRTMRRRGITVAVQVLSDSDNREDIGLIQETLIYIGLCAICTPDIESERHMVIPVLLGILEDERHSRRLPLLRHVLMALGNIMDCWTKEGIGYNLGDADRLVDAILKAWGSWKKSKDIATSASWALGAMLAQDGTQKTAVHWRCAEVKSLAAPWKAEFKTTAFLYNNADQRGSCRRQAAKLKQERDHMVIATTFFDEKPKAGDSVHAHARCEKHTLNKKSTIAKRRRSAWGAPCEDLTEDKRKKPTHNSRRLKTTSLESSCDVDGLPVSSRAAYPDDGISTAPSADIESGSRQLKKMWQDHPNCLTNGAQIRRSNRRKTLSVKPWYIGSGRSSLRPYAKRVPAEVIEISSDSDDERRPLESARGSRT